MKPRDDEHADEHVAGEKGERVRRAIGTMLSSEEPGVEPVLDDAPGTLADREPVPTSGTSSASVAAQKRLAEIERSVGELIESPELEQEGRAREAKTTR